MAKIEFTEIFEQPITFPDPDIQDRLNALVGLDNYKERLAKVLAVLIHPASLENWGKKHHKEAKRWLDLMQRRPPLVVLEGDVGCGKTELATTIGDLVAREQKVEITLLPISLKTRGHGMVGQMTQLLSAAFDHTADVAKKLKSDKKNRGAVIMLIDEADSLATTRSGQQMHQEDKVGVNVLLRGIDRLANEKLPAAVIMCTNRLGALDPAVKRRSAELLRFKRPEETQRRTLLEPILSELGIKKNTIDQIVKQTGATEERKYGCTYSDLSQRYIPGLILQAFPDQAVTDKLALSYARELVPTPPFE